MMRNGRAFQFTVCLLLIPVMSGCWLLRILGFPVGNDVPHNPKGATGDVTVHRDIQFADVPVPMGFFLNREKSVSFRGSSFRFGKFTYEGAWSHRLTYEFYERQMPHMGWNLVESKETGKYSDELLFEKGGEMCLIRVADVIDYIEVFAHVYKRRPGEDSANRLAAK